MEKFAVRREAPPELIRGFSFRSTIASGQSGRQSGLIEGFMTVVALKPNKQQHTNIETGEPRKIKEGLGNKHCVLK